MMATIAQRPNVTVTFVLELDQSEAAALDAIAGYGTDEFIKAFYEHMGRSYLEPYEAGLRKLFSTVRAAVPDILHRYRRAVEAFKEPAA